MKSMTIVALLGSLVCSASYAAETQPQLSYKQAKSLAEIAEHVISSHHIGGAISIVDNSGLPIIFERIDGATLANVELAPKKAHSAAAFGVSTTVFQQKIAAGNIGILGNPVVVPLPGGEPIKLNGVLVGAIGISTPDGAVDGEAASTVIKSLSQ